MTNPSIRKIVRVQDLVPDNQLWAAYELAHSVGHTPAAVLEAQKRHGILDLEIYRYADRLVMILTVTNSYDPAGLEAESAVVPDLVEWHTRMNALQRRPAPAQENWPEAHCVFRQSDHP